MPQTPNARISFGDILTAIENQMILDGVVSDPSQITWGNPEHIPQLSGPFDILLVGRNGQHTPYDGGGFDLRMKRMVDVWLRAEVAVPDPGGGFKTWITQMFDQGDGVIGSVGTDDFWPEDVDGNLLTIASIKLVGDAAPDYAALNAVYGTFVATLEVIYYPKVNPGRGVYPMP